MTMTDPDLDGHGIGIQPEAPAPRWRQYIDRIPAAWRTRQVGIIAGAAVVLVALGVTLGVTLGGADTPVQPAENVPADSGLNVTAEGKCRAAVNSSVWDDDPAQVATYCHSLGLDSDEYMAIVTAERG